MFLFKWILKFYRHLEVESSSPVYSYLKEEGVVVDTIRPSGKGKVRLCGVYWAARTDRLTQWPVLPNTVVAIKERVGLVLIVEPLPIENSTHLSAVVSLSRKLRTPSEENAEMAA